MSDETHLIEAAEIHDMTIYEAERAARADAERARRLELDRLIVRIGKAKTVGQIIIALSQFADDTAVYRAVSKQIQVV